MISNLTHGFRHNQIYAPSNVIKYEYTIVRLFDAFLWYIYETLYKNEFGSLMITSQLLLIQRLLHKIIANYCIQTTYERFVLIRMLIKNALNLTMDIKLY